MPYLFAPPGSTRDRVVVLGQVLPQLERRAVRAGETLDAKPVHVRRDFIVRQLGPRAVPLDGQQIPRGSFEMLKRDLASGVQRCHLSDGLLQLIAVPRKRAKRRDDIDRVVLGRRGRAGSGDDGAL